MKFCPNCGSPIEDGHKFCANCGEKLDIPASAPVEMPPEPVYTDDPALMQDPVLSTPPSFDAPAPKEEKVPELTLEPDLWGLGAAAAAAAEPAPKPEPAPAAQAAAPAQAAEPASAQPEAAAAAAQAPVFASVMEDVQYDNPLRDEKEQAHELPNDYTMSQQQEQVTDTDIFMNENLMLAWSIVLTALCSICGVVGLVKTIKARKAPWAEKVRLLKSAKVWLIVGTALRVLGYFAAMF